MCCPDNLATGDDAASIDPLDVLTSMGGTIIDEFDTAAAVCFTTKAELVKHLASLHEIQGGSSRPFAAVLGQHKLRGPDGLTQRWLHHKGAQYQSLTINAYWFRPHQGSGGHNNRDVFLEIHGMAKDCETRVAPGQRRKLFDAAKYDEESLQTWKGLVAPEAGGESSSVSGGSEDGFLDDDDDEGADSGIFPARDEEDEKEEEERFKKMVAGFKRRASSDRRGSRAHHAVDDGDVGGRGGGDEEDGDDNDGGGGVRNSKDGGGSSRGSSSSSSDGVQSDGEAVQVDDSPDALDLAERRLLRLKREKRRRKKIRQRRAETEQRDVPAPGGSGSVQRSTRTRRLLRRVSKIRREEEEEEEAEEDRPQQVRPW